MRFESNHQIFFAKILAFFANSLEKTRIILIKLFHHCTDDTISEKSGLRMDIIFLTILIDILKLHLVKTDGLSI